MIKRKMIYATLLLGMLVNTQTLVAQTPQEVVKSMISIFEKTAVSAKYIISVQEQGSDVPYIYRGNLLMHDEKFALKANGLDVCYDGKTQYVYMSEAQEISISEPTAEELLEVNPILMAKAMYESCEMTFSAMASTGTYEIELHPKRKIQNLSTWR